MRILADENVPGDTGDALRRQGHDVAWIREEAPGESDAKVLERAGAQERIIITFDKDFGELTFRSGLPASIGVILIRVQAPDPATLTRIVVSAIESRTDWTEHFSVLEPDRVRMTPLPPKRDLPGPGGGA